MKRLAVVALAACSSPQAAPAMAPQPAALPQVAAVTPDAGLAPAPDAAPADQPPALRLPKTFVPTGYEAQLAIDPAQPTFAGHVAISGHVAERAQIVWLHGRHLAISAAAATQADGAHAITATPRGEELLELRADPPLAPGDATIELTYRGEIDPLNTAGAFVQRTGGAAYVFSQFEAVYARRVFPCVDEPDSKVPWQLAIDAPKGSLAVSNTALDHEEPLPGGGHRYRFAKTKPLPAYLVAFGVGPFDIVEGTPTKHGTPVRAIVPHGRAAEAAWAAKSTARVLELLEDYFGQPYPFDKLDVMAIPITIGFGAMENAGLVTFTEKVMLFDPKNASIERRHTWIGYASHELSHQWFGDYVTTAWWDDIWLNEGFANWLQNKIEARFDPAWHDDAGELGQHQGALAADSVVSARAVRQPIVREDDIFNVFDGITYNKGASILAMFEHYVGPEVFQRGVRDYVRARGYGNATWLDFVGAISAVAGKDLAPAFATFLDQPGAPEITAKLACGRGAPRIELAQRRFVAPGSPQPAAGTPWQLPVCVAYERDGKRAEACTMLTAEAGELALDAARCPRWVLPNVEARGYYRARLSVETITALRDEAWPLLSATERRALFADVEGAAYRGQLPLPLALSLVPKLLAEGDRFAIQAALGLPLGFDRLVAPDQRTKYEAWLRATFGAGAAKLGALPAKADDLDAETIRGDLVRAVAWSGRDPVLVAKAVELAAAHDWRALPQAMRGTLLAIAVDANAELFDRVLHDVRGEPDRAKRTEMLYALAGVRDPARLERALAIVLDPQFDLRESASLMYGTSTEATREVAAKFFRAHQAELAARSPKDAVAGGLGRALTLVAGACDAAKRDDVAAYAAATFSKLPGGERSVNQTLEWMDQCIANRAVLEPALRGWLAGVKIAKPEPAKRPQASGLRPQPERRGHGSGTHTSR